jgi:transposase InsO family protein
LLNLGSGRHDRRMLELLVVLVRALTLACRGHRELVLENLALRQQLTALRRTTKRARLQTRDRLFWIALARGWRNWHMALVLVQPDTVVRWHRDWLRRRWTRRSQRRPDGRPPIDQQIRALVRDMASANPLWGAPRIHGELRTLGVNVSERTVSRLLKPHARPPSQTWRAFLTNHLASAASMDFFTVPTLTGRVLFVLVVLSHHRRHIVHFNITAHPTATWAAQQVVEAFPDDTAPRWLHRDRDNIYGDVFRRRLTGMGIAEVVSAPASPWQNPYVERLIGSLRRECLDHMIVLNEAHLRRVLTSYRTYYHRTRTHLGLGKDAPDRRSVAEMSTWRIVAIPEVGGLHHRYERRAA